MKNLFFAFILLCGGINIFAQTENPQPQQQVKRITMGVINGKATSLPKPEYPAAAKAIRASGTVNVEVTIDENGSVISAKAVSGHPLLQAAATAAARQAKFSPVKLNGQAVKVSGVIVYNFVAPPVPSEEQKAPGDLVFFTGVSMFLTALKDVELGEEENSILREMADSLPADFADEKAQLNRLITAGRGEHVRIIDGLIASFGRRLTGTQLWLFDFGKYWGDALRQAQKLSGNNPGGDKVKFIDSINKMTALLNSAPKDIPANVLEKIRRIALVNDENDMASPEFINDFLKASFEFMDFIAPDEKENGTD